MKLKSVFKKELFLTLFSVIVVFSILQNPMFSALNIIAVSKQVTVTLPSSINGLSVEGSCLVNQQIEVFQMMNQTSGELVNVYQITITVYNFMSALLLISPIVIYIYFSKKNKPFITKTLKKH